MKFKKYLILIILFFKFGGIIIYSKRKYFLKNIFLFPYKDKMNLTKISLTVFIIFYFGSYFILSAQFKPGRYEGNAKGVVYHNDSGIIKVEVVVSESTIDSIFIIKYEQTTRHKKYGGL